LYSPLTSPHQPDAGGSDEWLFGSLSAALRIVTDVETLPSRCSERRQSLAVDLEATTTFEIEMHHVANRSFIKARAAGRVAIGVDIAKNLIWWKL
jgi:hypothetical protein